MIRATRGGSHIGSGSYERTGHCGLGTAVKSLGLATSRPLKLDYIVRCQLTGGRGRGEQRDRLKRKWRELGTDLTDVS